VHENSVRGYNTPDTDPRYINVCVEACDGFPVNFEEIKGGSYRQKC
jgi:hypothetical protein